MELRSKSQNSKCLKFTMRAVLAHSRLCAAAHPTPIISLTKDMQNLSQDGMWSLGTNNLVGETSPANWQTPERSKYFSSPKIKLT